MIPWDKRDFKKLFPALSEELEEADKYEESMRDRATEEPLRGFIPGPEDYIRRCSTDEEALGVIEFLRKTGEISDDESERLKRQVGERGVRSFGPLREEGYYLRTYLGKRRAREWSRQSEEEK